MKKLTFNQLDNLVKLLSSKHPLYTFKVLERDFTIGVLCDVQFLSNDDLKLISRALSGICWFVEPTSHNFGSLYVSFSKSYYVR